MEQVRGYDKVWAFGLCASCEDKGRCPGIRKCPKEKTEIKLRSLTPQEITARIEPLNSVAVL